MHTLRLLKHLLHPAWLTRRAFPAAARQAITAAVTAAEQGHSGEIRFVVEGALPLGALRRDQSARERALEVFSQLRIWDTEANNGVLIYLLLADRDVEIVADRGLAARVSPAQWEALCRSMETHFANGEFELGALRGINATAALLRRHFPRNGPDSNELPDEPVLF